MLAGWPMKITARILALLALPLCLPALAGSPKGGPPQSKYTPSSAQILSESKPAEWRKPDPEDLLVMRLASGRIVMELRSQAAMAEACQPDAPL